MQQHERRFNASDGLSLFCRSWEAELSGRAVLAIVHGVTEHGGRYSVIGEPMADSGFIVCAFDLRGHGQSAGRRGHVASWGDYVSDLNCFLDLLSQQYRGLPVFLFGHSLGSLIALAYVMDHPDSLAGLIISGTAVDPVGVARPHLVAIARLFSKCWPTFALRVKATGRQALSRDARVDAAYAADPLVLRTITARMGTEALDMIAFVKQRAAKVTTSLLAVHGGADPLNSLVGAQAFFEGVRSLDKQMIVYPGSLHEVYNDLDQSKILTDLRKWIEQRVPPPTHNPVNFRT